MFGVFKKLFSRTTSTSSAAPAVEESVTPPEPSPAPSSSPVAPAAATPAAARAAAPGADTIALPLKDILMLLPESVAALVLERSSGTFSMPTATAVQQLRSGAVRIPFAQLRKGSPGGTFSHDTSHDNVMIDLPLSLILAAIGPNGLARRTDQKRTTVPDEVMGVFGAKDRKVVISPAGSAPPSAPKAAPAAPAPPAPSAPKPAPQAATPAAGPVAVKPPTPAAAPKMTTSIAQAPTTAKAPASSPLPFASQKSAAPLAYLTGRPSPLPPPAVAPMAPVGVAPTPAPAPAPVVAAAPAEVPAAVPPAAPAAAPATSDNTVVITLESVSAAWPDAVRQEIQQFNLVSETISIPISRIEPGMKAGRLAFTWGELCGWLSDPLPPSANGQSEVELPLGAIAPQFLTKRRATTPRKIVSVGADVPDLFAGLNKPAEPPPEAAVAPEAGPEVEAVTPDTAAAAEPEAQPDLSPQEVVEWILTLPGVAGALLASNDGLLVAGQLPAPLEAETMAAFLPQILMRVGICTEEIRLGPLRSVMLFVGKTPCAMFKAGALCLAVLGQPGKTLPEAALERMALELAQLNQ